MTYFKDPANGERDALLHFVEGGVYPKWYSVVSEFKHTGDLMPVMTKFARIAPAGLARYRGAAFGPEYQGNLFSAQFNPHRVQRHVLHREGATFRTEDSDFLTSRRSRLPPHRCDRRRRRQPAGGRYRRVVHPRLPDFARCQAGDQGRHLPHPPRREPRRLRIRAASGWTSRRCSCPAIAKLLGDARPAVRDRAIERLVEQGDPAVPALASARKVRPRTRRAPRPSSRCSASARRQRGPKCARRSATSDFRVRTRRRPLRRHGGGPRRRRPVDRRWRDGTIRRPGGRRLPRSARSAIAGAAPALLAAAADPEDRFVEHSVIYSLITLHQTRPLLQALGRSAAQSAQSGADRARPDGRLAASERPDWPAAARPGERGRARPRSGWLRIIRTGRT